MKLKEYLLSAIFLLIASILFVPQDRMDIIATIIIISGILGFIYWLKK
jgi:hypothetical protein